MCWSGRAHHAIALPGGIVEIPGYFRIFLTASDEMVERSIARFGAAIKAATT